MHEKYFDPTYQKLIHVLAGVVFLGTPHPTYKNEKTWPRLGSILRSKSKFSRPIIAEAELEAAIVANVSQRFEEIGLEIPIVSVYEQKKTRIGEGPLKAKELVGQTSCKNLVGY